MLVGFGLGQLAAAAPVILPEGDTTIAQCFSSCHYPQLRRSFFTETYPNLHRPCPCSQPSDGLKPRRGGLFIATDVPGPPFLFFGGAAFEKSATEVPSSNDVLCTEMLHRRAAEKQDHPFVGMNTKILVASDILGRCPRPAARS